MSLTWGVTVLPESADKERILLVSMKKGYETVYIPHRLLPEPDGEPAVRSGAPADGGADGSAGEVSLRAVVELPLSSEANSFEWYEPVDKRDMVGGWAYGPQNTYYVEAGQSKKIDVKARGDFFKASAPKYYGIILGAYPLERKCVEMPDGVDAPETAPTRLVNEDWTIDVKVTTTDGPWGVVGIYDENHKLLWSYFICKYYSGDAPQDFQYTADIVMMDRTLGQVESTVKALEAKKFDGNIPYFQWGRKDPVLLSNTNASDTWKMAVATGVDIATTIANPTIMYVHGPNLNWTDGALDPRLWGGQAKVGSGTYDKSVTGHKTIYDPCPEGYRVPDPKVFAEIKEKAVVREKKLNGSNTLYVSGTANTNQLAEWIQPTGFDSYSILAYPVGTTTDIWPYFGWKNYSTAAALNYNQNSSTNTVTGAVYWCNGTNAAGARGASLEYAYYSSSKINGTRYDLAPSVAAAVRCQKETNTPGNANPSITLPELEEVEPPVEDDTPKYIALSFDDGPHCPSDMSESTSMAMLDQLEKYDIPATFFLLGYKIEAAPEKAKQVLQRGVSLGCEYQNHSYSHVRMDNMTAAEVAEEVSKTNKLIYDIIGVTPKFFRPPYLETSTTMHNNIDLCFISGTSTNDSKSDYTAQMRADMVLSNPQSGDIVLMHDFGGNQATVDALDIIIPALKKRGFTFVTVSEIFKLRKGGMPAANNGVVYRNAFNQ